MNTHSSLDRLKKQLHLNSGSSGSAVQRPHVAFQSAFTNFAEFPEYKDFATMRWFYEKQGYTQNQFRSHLGVSDAVVTVDGRQLVNFSSYNYLALAGDPRVKAAAKEAVEQFGTSTGSGRAITGEIDLHQEFEREICEVLGTEDAVLSVGGYSTNAFTIGYLCRAQDLIIYDELIHNSALAGCRMTTARRFSFPHNDYAALDRLLAEHRGSYERALVIVEGVYSMDGDIPDLPQIIEIKRRHKALLMVDEAHSMGVIGPRGLGITDYFNIDGRDIDIHYGSMSKAFGTCGGYVAGHPALVAILKNYAPGVLLYGAAPTPANTAAGLAALKIMRAEPERALRVQKNAASFIAMAKAAGLDTYHSQDSGVVPIMMRDSELALWLSIQLFEHGVCTYPMIYPIVPRDRSRLRFFINTNHTQQQLSDTIELIAKFMRVAPASKGVF